jgi:hypothetical protein
VHNVAIATVGFVAIAFATVALVVWAVSKRQASHEDSEEETIA